MKAIVVQVSIPVQCPENCTVNQLTNVGFALAGEVQALAQNLVFEKDGVSVQSQEIRAMLSSVYVE